VLVLPVAGITAVVKSAVTLNMLTLKRVSAASCRYYGCSIVCSDFEHVYSET
jgi:hypothetical protein